METALLLQFSFLLFNGQVYEVLKRTKCMKPKYPLGKKSAFLILGMNQRAINLSLSVISPTGREQSGHIMSILTISVQQLKY